MSNTLNCFRVLALLSCPMLACNGFAQYYSPSPYLSFSNPAGAALSPFANISFATFHLENFEDGILNTPGVTFRESATVGITTAFSDSVDDDDGVIDGVSSGNSTSLYSNFLTSTFTFDFNRAALGGQLPTHAGLVWTDIGRNNGGTPLHGDLVNNVIFEAFDQNNVSLGVQGPFSVGDTSISRTTPEDRFFGVTHMGGISSIRISMPGKNNWEIDHLQYGIASDVVFRNGFESQ